MPSLVARPLFVLYRSWILRLILIRILQAIPILFGVTFLVFTLLNILPGGTVESILGYSATPQLVQELTAKLGLNHPFLIRYFHWLRLALHGNFGDSLLDGVPVSTTIASRIPVSAEIGGAAFIEALILAVPVSVLVAKKPGGALDRINILISMFGFSCPAFVTALLGILLFAVHLHWFRAVGFVPVSQGIWSNLHSIVLPSATIAFGIFCGYTRILRADLIDQMNGEDYIVTARAKGVPETLILLRHALRNAIFNIITVAVLNIGTIVAGAVLIEEIFGIPGMGLLLLNSISNKDVVTVQADVTLIACAIVGANLAADVLYSLLDPRVRYGRPES